MMIDIHLEVMSIVPSCGCCWHVASHVSQLCCHFIKDHVNTQHPQLWVLRSLHSRFIKAHMVQPAACSENSKKCLEPRMTVQALLVQHSGHGILSVIAWVHHLFT